MKRYLSLFCISALLYGSDSADSWAGRSGFQLLNRPFGADGITRGEAGTALPGTFSRWYNPALYGADSGYSMGFEVLRQGAFSDRTSAAFDFGIRTKDRFFDLEGSNHIENAGFAVDEFGTKAPDTTKENLVWQSTELSFSFGKKRTEYLTWGGTIGTAFDRADGETAYAVLFGLGAQARFLKERLLIGASALNWGITTPMINTGVEEYGKGERLPSTVRIGTAWRQPLKNGYAAAAADAVYHHVYDTSKSVTADIEKRISYPVGVEISPVKWAEVRAGREFNGGTALGSFGFGFNTPWVDTDIGMVVNKFGSSREISWMAGVKFHYAGIKIEKVDPYKYKKRAVYRPAASVSPEISPVKNTADTVPSAPAIVPDSAKSDTASVPTGPVFPE